MVDGVEDEMHLLLCQEVQVSYSAECILHSGRGRIWPTSIYYMPDKPCHENIQYFTAVVYCNASLFYEMAPGQWTRGGG